NSLLRGVQTKSGAEFPAPLNLITSWGKGLWGSHLHHFLLLRRHEFVDLFDVLVGEFLDFLFVNLLAVLGDDILRLLLLRCVHPLLANGSDPHFRLYRKLLHQLHHFPATLFGKLGNWHSERTAAGGGIQTETGLTDGTFDVLGG